MTAASVDARGRMLYQDKKGFEDVLRKHERSSGTADIWLHDAGKFSKLTDFNGHDMNPVWAPGCLLYTSGNDHPCPFMQPQNKPAA